MKSHHGIKRRSSSSYRNFKPDAGHPVPQGLVICGLSSSKPVHEYRPESAGIFSPTCRRTDHSSRMRSSSAGRASSPHGKSGLFPARGLSSADLHHSQILAFSGLSITGHRHSLPIARPLDCAREASAEVSASCLQVGVGHHESSGSKPPSSRKPSFSVPSASKQRPSIALSREDKLLRLLLQPSACSDSAQKKVHLEEDKIPIMSSDTITSLITTAVPGASEMLDRLGEKPICHYICLSYQHGLPAQADIPALHLHTKLALRYILHTVSDEGQQKAQRVKVLTSLAEAYQGCQQIQARVIDALFGTLTGRDLGLRGQLLELVDLIKQRSLDEVTLKLHPQCLNPEADMDKQMLHIQSAYVTACGEDLGLRGVETSRADRMKPRFNKTQVTKFAEEYRRTFPVKDVIENLVRDVNQVGTAPDRMIDINVLFKWCGEAKDETGFDAQSVMYQGEHPELYDQCGGPPPEDSAAASLCAPWLHYGLALDILILCFGGRSDKAV